LAFSVAVCAEPDVLLLDEVLAVGDESFRDRCFRHLKAFHESGRTLVVVSHDLASVRALCTRAVWLDHGNVRMSGPVDLVLDAYQRFAHDKG
jgi:lipopolysaccharide transport system ATP-binding protein